MSKWSWNILSSPGEDETALEYWKKERLGWWERQGIDLSNIEIYDVPENELAHYSKRTLDIMYRFPHGLEELEGIANRTDFDLGSHKKPEGFIFKFIGC